MLEVEIIKEYGDTRAINVELNIKVKSLRKELEELKASTISINKLRKFIYISADGSSMWIESKCEDEIKELLGVTND